MHHAFQTMIPAALKGALNSPVTAVLSQAAAKVAFSYALEYLLPVNGSIYSLNDNWSAIIDGREKIKFALEAMPTINTNTRHQSEAKGNGAMRFSCKNS